MFEFIKGRRSDVVLHTSAILCCIQVPLDLDSLLYSAYIVHRMLELQHAPSKSFLMLLLL